MLAPRSSASTPRPSTVGIIGASAGRSIPSIRPTTSRPVVIKAPVLPAESIASACPSRTSRPATTIEASFLRRTALTGSSSASMISPAWCITKLDGASASSGLKTFSSPTRIIWVSLHSLAAAKAPSTVLFGAWSPPIASMAIRMLTSPFMIVLSARAINYKVTLEHHFLTDIGKHLDLGFTRAS
ncbi:hypothetical protein D3C74_301210 [compost metagenome]